ncbi:MAG: hypothetical protein IJ333_01230, partial [Clostridia bacterium]|nr:hypothetical protein [Clostridia bacterium]
TDLTREQAAAIFYRYSNYKGYNTTSRASLLTFEDGVRVNDYAIDALSWAIATEPEALLSGTSATTLDPHGTALRAQLAVILKRYYNYTHHQGSLHTAIEITERYHYKTLSPKLQECYLRMDTAVKKLSTSFWLGKDLTAEDIARIYNSYIEDNPEHFYMGLHYSYKIYDNANVEFLLYYSDGVTSNEETLSAQLKESILTKKARFDEAVHQVLHTIPVGASQPEKEKMIYDWIISNNRYASEVLNWDLDSISESPDELTAYGAMVNGIGVCESYAGAFQVLCHAVGIHCTSIEGTADGMPHKWNAVFLDGEWYFVDPTYGDPLLFDGTNYLDGPIETPIPYYHYDYFNKTTAQTAASHIPDNLLPNPTCTGTKYNYNYFVS